MSFYIKYCNKNFKCLYEHAFEKTCAYREDLKEYGLCLTLFKNWDYIIDELAKESKIFGQSTLTQSLYFLYIIENIQEV